MKMTNLEIVNNVNALNTFVQKDIPVPYKLSYAISKNLKKLISAVEPFEETRKSIVANESLSEEEKVNEINSILTEECEVEIHTISESLLELACEKTDLSTKDIMLFDFMVEGDSDTNDE